MTREELAKLLIPIAEEYNATILIPSSKEREENKMTIWERNANHVAVTYGAHVDWEERFYECPSCGEPVYECDWEDADLIKFNCPICEDIDLEEEEEE